MKHQILAGLIFLVAISSIAQANVPQLSCDLKETYMKEATGPADDGQMVTNIGSRIAQFKKNPAIDSKNLTAEMQLDFDNGQTLKVYATLEAGKEDMIYVHGTGLSASGKKLSLSLGSPLNGHQNSIFCEIYR